MLYDYHKYFLNYLIHLYGGSYEIQGHILFMHCGDDMFKVSLLDGSRFDRFTFFHKNYKANLGHFHKQFDCHDLEYGLFRCFTHDFNLKNGIQYSKEDCDSFVFNATEEFFFVIPTNKVEIGDIILIAGKPKCVIEVEKNKITVINYEDSTIDTVLPERHVFMGNTYFYGKIVSMFGNDFKSGKKGINKMMSYMMMSEMMKGNGNATNNSNSMLPMMLMMNGGFTDMFDGIFDFNATEDESEAE